MLNPAPPRRLAPAAALFALTLTLSPRAQVAAPPTPPNPAAAAAIRQHNAELAAADRREMMTRLGLSEPAALPSPEDDPHRPAGVHHPADRPQSWTDDQPGHSIARSNWGHWTNYDLNKAEVGTLPDPLVLRNGERVRDADTWWKKRRPEILDDFQREIYGRIPAMTPQVKFEVRSIEPDALEGAAKIKHIIGVIDNASYPAAKPEIDVTLYTPAHATGPVPVMVMIGGFAFGQPSAAPAGPSALQQLLAKGWGCAAFNPTSVQADTGAGLNAGIIGLVGRGQPRQPEDWGSLAAIAWGLSRTIDYFETDKDVDAKRLGVEGHSRWGKATAVAMAYEPRWAIGYSSCSGEGGTKLHRHDIGECVDNVCAASEYHWMAGNFLKYGGRWDALPIDQHELIALIAPRPIFVTGGTTDLWSDPVGEFKACVAAGPVYRLLGKKDVGQTAMPAPDAELISGDIGFRFHAGGHTDALDWPTFLKFADKYFAPTK
jgi:hypothetical protein